MATPLNAKTSGSGYIKIGLISIVFLIGIHLPCLASDCRNESVSIIPLIEAEIIPKVVSMQQACWTYLLPGFLLIGIFCAFLDYHRGQLDWKRSAIAAAVVIALLSNYATSDNFRKAIRDSASKAATSIQGGNTPSLLFSSLSEILRNLDLAQDQSTPISKAAAIFALFVTPAGILMILLSITFVILGGLSYVFDIGTIVILLAFDILGPLALLFGIIPATRHIAIGWMFRYCEVALYKIIYACFMVAVSTLFQVLAANFNPNQILSSDNPLELAACTFTVRFLGVVVAAVGIWLFARIPRISAALVSGHKISDEGNVYSKN